jgi:hypothetical protein
MKYLWDELGWAVRYKAIPHITPIISQIGETLVEEWKRIHHNIRVTVVESMPRHLADIIVART